MTTAITDFTQYSGLRSGAERNDPAVLREVAGQFEALFVQQMLKNMREASLADPIFGNSEQHDMYQEMMDQQLAAEVSGGKGIGLADMLVRQLGGEDAAKLQAPDRPFPIRGRETSAWSDAESFAQDVWPHAERAANRLGVKPEAILAQAALETGWGKHVMPDANGGNSFNLFGIKAGSAWSGDTTSKRTLEFEDGIPRYERATFRAYGDIGATFDDYAKFLANNPRYADVTDKGVDSPGFARALQDSGYATDPEYANKLTSILESPTMRRVLSELKNPQSQPIPQQVSAHLQ
jgi:flagellar protein FlgJ